MSAADHYEAQAAEAGELARYRAALETIAQPTTGYQCWHIATAREALGPADPADPGWETLPLPLDGA